MPEPTKDEIYWKKYYRVSVSHGNKSMQVFKDRDSDWSHISITINGTNYGEITTKSRENAEQLWFLLGQMLDKNV